MFLFSTLLRRTPLLLLLSLALGAAQNTHALTAQQARAAASAFHEVQVLGYQTVNAYYQFSISPGDKQVLQTLQEKVAAMDAQFAKLPQLKGVDDLAGQIGTLTALWQDYRKLLDANRKDIEKQGYADLRLVTELDDTSLTIVNGAGFAVEQSYELAGIKPGPALSRLRQVRLQILALLSQYSARSASTVSQVFRGSDSEVPVEEQLARVDRSLAELNDLVSESDARVKLKKIATQWAFIEPSIAAPDAENVSYVVNLYSNRIVQALAEVESLL